ncbi:hypothetical protein L195_g032613 [Trifolium pratense]|uniref:Uncharacterized protein n=1 Tax=Trifolium pratense TaxID=57577 RepID=A0A2K3LDN4_TRIPR|nr:hypothetical protein L195_g032613 [Trifolium pratense]
MGHSFGLTGGYSVRLVSQCSEHLLLTVEGSQAAAPGEPSHLNHHSLASIGVAMSLTI